MAQPIRKIFLACAVSSVLLSPSAALTQNTNAQQPPPPTQTFALIDTSDLQMADVKADAVEYRGKKAVKLVVGDKDGAGLAFLKGTDFHDGTISVDIATHLTTPPGVRMPGFTGIAFRAQDAGHYELFYLRPGNSSAEDQAMRNHSVQYSYEPDYGWEKLRRNWPFIYESWSDLQLDEWTHLKIEVHGRVAKLFVNGSAKPSLIVDGMKGASLDGPIALWGYGGEEAYFANLTVENTKPDPIENGSDIAGTWDVKFATDAGAYAGTMKLVRQNGIVTGFWSGDLGPEQMVSGFWRDGYVELSFGGSWPDQPGTVIARLAGWVDGDAAKGRLNVQGRADGRWSAVRKK